MKSMKSDLSGLTTLKLEDQQVIEFNNNNQPMNPDKVSKYVVFNREDPEIQENFKRLC